MRRVTAFALLLAASFHPLAAQSQPGPLVTNAARYHFGDNPVWANPTFDDCQWPSTKNGEFPSPGYGSDGYFWVRARIAVPAGDSGALALESRTSDPFPNVQELWVNGRLVGRYGDFPLHARPLVFPRLLVFDIPAGVAQPGSIAEIAQRTWNAPSDMSESLVLRHPDPTVVQFSIAGAPLLHALAAQAQDRAWLDYSPQLTLTILFVVLGLAVLALGIRTRDRTLLLCALWLVALPGYLAAGLLRHLLAGTPTAVGTTVFLLLNAVGMCVVVEFIWMVQAFRDRIFRAVAHLCWICLTIGGVYSSVRVHPGISVTAGMLTENWFLFLFNVIIGGAQLVALAGRGRNRPIAAAMLLISTSYFLGIAGYANDYRWLGLNLFSASFDLSSLFIAVLLMRQTWIAWRKAEDLRVEFAAARELQQELVPNALPALPGWRLGAAYLPAAEVGGDFYHIVERPEAAILLIGDVSGKGLKAAMTGLLTIGAASALAAEFAGPAQLLTRLNREMVRLQKGGFVTCLCARIGKDGALTIANAGHLAPFRNGEEIEVDNGLPLGIAADAAYAESTLQLSPNDQLTFLSDGIVEAKSPTGALFGFDRTAAISTQSAEAIAQAARAYGQEDDITVLTLAFAPADMLQATTSSS